MRTRFLNEAFMGICFIALYAAIVLLACDSHSSTPSPKDAPPSHEVFPHSGNMTIAEADLFTLPSGLPDYDVVVYHDDKRGETCWLFRQNSNSGVGVWCQNDNALCLNGVFGPNTITPPK